MTRDERRTWAHIGVINAILVLSLAALFLAGCGDCARVVADVTVALDGGTGAGTTTPASYCATECDTSAECASGFHCSLHEAGVSGLCFRDFNADGGR